MRNLGLALLLIGSLLAPHAALAKKHAGGKKGRSAKAQKHAKRAHRESLAPSQNDTLASAVADRKRDEPTTMTAVAPTPPAPAPAARAAAEPVAPNAPMRMDNQTNDDEVPGARKKR